MDQISKLKIKINELNEKIKERTSEKEKFTQKAEKARVFCVDLTLISGIIHVLGYLTTPILTLSGMVLVCSTVPIGGTLHLIYLGKEDKIQKEIDACTTDLQQAQNDLELLINTPNSTYSKVDLPTISSKKQQTAQKTKR